MNSALKDLVLHLEQQPRELKFHHLSKKEMRAFLRDTIRVVSPYHRSFFCSEKNSLENHLKKLEVTLVGLIGNLSLNEDFFSHLKLVSELIEKDAKAIFDGDPATDNISEIYLSSPGLYAITTYRIANFFHEKGIELIPRILSEIAHERTGIDIHPGAKIGESFMIDHGTGVVIGETAEIGNNVKVYQGVTLGALSVDKALARKKRHPTIANNVIIYANATILGGHTYIGESSMIGGNVWLTKSVPSHSVVYHKSEIELITKENNFIQELIYEI